MNINRKFSKNHDTLSTSQFIADIFDQFDTALDYLKTNDRNYHRYAFILIDNGIELLISEKCRSQNIFTIPIFNLPTNKKKLIISAIETDHFEAKLKLCKSMEFFSESKKSADDIAQSISILHNLRNSVYHNGFTFDIILRSLGVLYLKIGCILLSNYSPTMFWSSFTKDIISRRALKYFKFKNKNDLIGNYELACSRLQNSVGQIPDNFVLHIQCDIKILFDYIENYQKFIIDKTNNFKIDINNSYLQEIKQHYENISKLLPKLKKRFYSISVQNDSFKNLAIYWQLCREIEPLYAQCETFKVELET